MVVDANMYWIPESLFTSEEVLARFVAEAPQDENTRVYLKEGDAVADFLGMMQAEKSVERFEVARNLKEVRGQVNRLVNCETANLQKAVDAAGRQLADIRRIERAAGLEGLPDILRETAEARLAHPDASLAELAALLCVSKPGVNHRLRKLHAMAEELVTD